MAESHVKDFFDHVDRDPEMQKELKTSVSHIRDMAAKHGHHFTLQEMYAHIQKRSGIKNPVQYADPDTCCFV
ncbi:MAG: Nif11-like leader peptide family natural product precursor [Terriglobales bacterium]